MAEAGPLSHDDLALLDATLLPALERHHLRLLAHSLRSLQEIVGRRDGALPSQQEREHWVDQQPVVAGDPGFRQAFLMELDRAACQLDALAAALGRSPLALQLGDLITWVDGLARARVSGSSPLPGSPAPPSPG
ncbi:hypothetical protein KBY97_11740 [Synechococcus sp. ATX 2A4]|uniref:hypothetical protein n=1 Tax=Synechococcus sp. ATX 2A4 TaxID=2823727 RepID=UPI0020CC6363|nr:hypothetical protein [Synechococcus sp. ATX 2A4]MCP9885788.1 hypothetical protein [Synechococcus sp. ATX 2A4]